MFYIPETLEAIQAKLKEINDHVVNANDPNLIHHFYAQALIEAYYNKQIDDEKAVS
jgi:hypothetical protein